MRRKLFKIKGGQVMDHGAFQKLTTPEVAQLVQEIGPRVCAFPINGTRRWFMLEHPPTSDDYWEDYMIFGSKNHVEMYGLFFEHGIHTLLNPIFGPDILQRGEDYMRMSAPGMEMMVTHPIFREFYDQYDVRVRFYGDHRRHFANTPYAYLSDIYDQVYEDTKHHSKHRLYYGVCANDATETVAEMSIRYYLEHGKAPDRDAIVQMYYGEHVDPVDVFIGFDKFAAYDMPLLATGNEDLYFMISPSPYLTAEQLRGILYDHLFARRDEENETDYAHYTEADWRELREFYYANRGKTLGIGIQHPRLGYWHPVPQLEATLGHLNNTPSLQAET